MKERDGEEVYWILFFYFFLLYSWQRRTTLILFLCADAEGFRVQRQAVEEEEQGTLSKFADKVKSFYQSTVDAASGYVENIRGYKIEDKIK